MPQHTATLPIACVEGWSVTRTWTGVRLRDLAALAGVPDPDNAFVQSIETSGAFARATLQSNQVLNPDALLALKVGNEGGTDRRPRPRPRLPGAGDRPGAARGPQHQVGLVDRLPPEGRVMRAALRSWRHLYGENPLHLLVMVGCFALVGYVVSFVYPGPEDLALLIWFAGAVLAHDLVLYPLYALADQPLVFGRRARRRALPRRPPLVPAINHVRVPVLGSAVLGLIYFPTITQRGEDAFRFTAGLGTAGIYQHWLLSRGCCSSAAPSSTPCAWVPRRGAAPYDGGRGSPSGPRSRPVTAPRRWRPFPEDAGPEDAGPEDAGPEDAGPESGGAGAGPRRPGVGDRSPRPAAGWFVAHCYRLGARVARLSRRP